MQKIINYFRIPKNNYEIMLFLFLASFLVQFIHISFFGITFKLYMILTVVFLFLSINSIKFKKLIIHEFLLVVLYVFITVTAIYAIDHLLALKIIFGQIIILSSYFLGRFLIDKVSLEKFEKIFTNLGKVYISISLILYILGIYTIFVTGFNPAELLVLGDEGTTFRIYGIYYEGQNLPRLAGLADYPNNFVYNGCIILFYFIYKREKLFILITFISLLLTFSSTFYLVFLISFSVYAFYKRLYISYFLLLLIVFVLGFLLYNEFSLIKDFIDYRMARNATGSGRFELWNYTLDRIAESPILGYGANQSRIIIEPFRVLMSTHNIYLEAFISSGIFALLILLLFVLSLFYISFLLVKKMKEPFFLMIFIVYFIFINSNNSLHVNAFYYLIIYVYASKLLRRRIVQ